MTPAYFNRIVSVYGIGADEFLDLFAAQQHRCPICRCALVLFSTDTREQPCVDHDHSTGAVRGILCRTCNTAIGWLEKRPGRTIACVAYLEGQRKKPPRPSRASSEQWSRDEHIRFRQSRRVLRTVLNAAATGRLGVG